MIGTLMKKAIIVFGIVLGACVPVAEPNACKLTMHFGVEPTTGTAPLKAVFLTDVNSGNASACGNLKYAFDFNSDGYEDMLTVSGSINHVFTVPGTYTTSLSVRSEQGSAVTSGTVLITVSPSSEWITPKSVTASGETKWGDTWYTGPATYAIDGNENTSWTLDGMGTLTLDLGEVRTILGIEAAWSGSVSNGNAINLYVDGAQVLSEERFGATKNTREFTPVSGRVIVYETVAVPHNDLLQVATWSEMAEFRVKAVVK